MRLPELQSVRAFALAIGLAAAATILSTSDASHAQTRAVGGGAMVLDDNAGHRLTVTTPQSGDAGYANWITGGALSWRLPIPPSDGAVMGFVAPGTSAGQALIWDAPTASGGTGGAQGRWMPGTIGIASGGTGATTAAAALSNLLPTQTGNSGKVLTTNGSTASWANASSAKPLFTNYWGSAYWAGSGPDPRGNFQISGTSGHTYLVHGVLNIINPLAISGVTLDLGLMTTNGDGSGFVLYTTLTDGNGSSGTTTFNTSAYGDAYFGGGRGTIKIGGTTGNTCRVVVDGWFTPNSNETIMLYWASSNYHGAGMDSGSFLSWTDVTP